MSKIVKLPNAKPITCACCGCTYEFESGDTVEVLYGNCYYADGTPIHTSRVLKADFVNGVAETKNSVYHLEMRNENE